MPDHKMCENCHEKQSAEQLVYRLGHEISGGMARIQGINNITRGKNRALYDKAKQLKIPLKDKLIILNCLDEIYYFQNLQLNQIIEQNNVSTKIILGMDKPAEKTSLFKKAVNDVIHHEGGYNDIKEDLGGATNWGVSLRFLESQGLDIDGDGDVDWEDVAAMTRDQAEDIYHQYFWKNEYDRIGGVVAMKVFDMGVNMGTRRAHKRLQEACNYFGSGLLVDGMVGVKTINMIRQIDLVLLLHQICFEQARYYAEITVRRPQNLKFLRGWMNRANYKPKS